MITPTLLNCPSFDRLLLGVRGLVFSCMLSALFLASSGLAGQPDGSAINPPSRPDHEALLKYTHHFTVPAKGTEFVMPVGSGDLSAMVSFDTALQLHFSKSDWFGRAQVNESYEKDGKTKLANMSPGHLTLALGELKPEDIVGFDQYMDFGRGSVVIHLKTAAGGIEIEVFGEMTQKALLIHVSDHRNKRGEPTITFSNWRPAMEIVSGNGILTGQEINKTGGDGKPVTDPAKVQPSDPSYQLGLGVAIGSAKAVSRDSSLIVPAAHSGEYDVIIAAAVTRDGAPLQAATTQLASLLAVDRQQQRQAQLDWWRKFWDKSWVELAGDKDAEYLSRLWLTDLYTFAGVFDGKIPPSFNGSQMLVMKDYSSWVNIYTFQNTRELIWPMWAANHAGYALHSLRNFDYYFPLLRQRTLASGKIGLRLTENINITDNPLLAWKPDLKPRELTPFDPARIEDRSNQTVEEIPAGFLTHYFQEGAELSHLMLDHVRFTGDEQFLKTVCAPWVRECTLFYLNYIKQGPDGLWHVEPADAAETWFKVRDPGIELCAVRHLFGEVVRHGKELGFEPELIDLARNRLEHLAPIPLGQWLQGTLKEEEIPELQKQYPKAPPKSWKRGATIFTGIDHDKDQFCVAAGIGETPFKTNAEDPELYIVYPYGRVGLASPAAELQRGINTFNARVCVNSYGWSPDGVWAARLGVPNAVDTILNHALRQQLYPYGGWINCAGQLPGTVSVLPPTAARYITDTPQLDTTGVNMMAIQETLLQSHDLADEEKLLDGGPIRLLPAIRSTWSGRFKLCAQGGFIVECSFADGQVTELQILSQRGRMLRLINPWTGKLTEQNTHVGERVVMKKP